MVLWIWAKGSTFVPFMTTGIMEQETSKRWRAMGEGASLVPFALFVVSAIGLSFFGAVDVDLLVAVGIGAVLVGTFLANDAETYWSTVFEYMGSKTAMTATLLWLVVGVYGMVLREGRIVEGLVWAADWLHIGGGMFTVVVFLFSGLFAVSTGSGFGTISAMSLTLFPAGVALGGEPVWLGGAILSGAALGDSVAPVSDTAVIAATTQEYSNGKGVADIGGTVKARLPFVVMAVAASVTVFLAAGIGLTEVSQGVGQHTVEGNPRGLALLVPTLVVIGLSFRRVNIFVALAVGLVLAVVIGLSLGLFEVKSLVGIEGGTVSGAVVNGIRGMASICILLMVVVSLSGLIIRSGCMERMIGRLNRRVIRSKRSAELTIFSLVSLAGILIAAVNTIANICVAPFVNSIGREHGLHPHRRATLLATVICTFPFILPYGGCVLLLLRGVEASGCGVPLRATDLFWAAVYPWTLWVVMLAACIMKKREG